MTFLNDMRSISSMLGRELQEFTSEVDNMGLRWLEEIEQEASHMFSGEVSTEPELMPKTPSQKRRARRKRVSIAQEEQPRRTRRGKRSSAKLELDFEEEVQPRASTSSPSDAAPLDDNAANRSQPGTATTVVEKMATEQPKQTQPEPFITTSPTSRRLPEVYVRLLASDRRSGEAALMRHRLLTTVPEPAAVTPPKAAAVAPPEPAAVTPPITPEPAAVGLPKAVVEISTTDRRSAEVARRAPSLGHATTETEATPETGLRRGVFLKLRDSLTGLKGCRASRLSLLKQNNKRSVTRATLQRSICSEDICPETDDEEEDKRDEMEWEPSAEATGPTEEPQEAVEGRNLVTRASTRHSTRSAAATSTPQKTDLTAALSPVRRSKSSKRKAEEPAENTVPKKKSVMKPRVNAAKKNRTLMTPLGRTPGSVGRTAVMKNLIKHITPLKIDFTAKELQKHEALQRKLQQEEEHAKKLDEEKKQLQEERKRKLQERQRRAAEVRAEKEERKEEERRRKIEQKKAQIDEKLRAQHLAEENLKRVRLAEENLKREEEMRLKRLQQDAEEERQALEAERRAEEEQERARQLEAERRAEEEQERARHLEAEERARKLEAEMRAEKEQERARQLEAEERVEERARKLEEMHRAMELRAAALREQVEAEKALALQQEREKRKVLEEQRRKEEQQRLAEAASNMQSSVMKTPARMMAAGLNVTVDVEVNPFREQSPGFPESYSIPPMGGNSSPESYSIPPMGGNPSPQSYSITPKGGNKPVRLSSNQDDYGMDQNSGDSTDDESDPRKPIPSWAQGPELEKRLVKEYFNPPDLHALFGPIEPPNLEEIFRTKKPRFFKRTSSAVWQSPPMRK